MRGEDRAPHPRGAWGGGGLAQAQDPRPLPRRDDFASGPSEQFPHDSWLNVISVTMSHTCCDPPPSRLPPQISRGRSGVRVV